MNITLLLAYLGTLQSMRSPKFNPLLLLPIYLHKNIAVQWGLDFSLFLPKECPNHQVTLAATLMVPLVIHSHTEGQGLRLPMLLASYTRFLALLQTTLTLQDRCARTIAQSKVDISMFIALRFWDETSFCHLLCGRILTEFLLRDPMKTELCYINWNHFT